MSILKSAAATEKEMKKILSDLVGESTYLREEIEKDMKKISEAEMAMENAMDSGDLDTYKTAKKAKEEAETAHEMHKKRLDKIEGGILITKEEYEKRVADIFKEYSSLRENKRKKIAKLFEEAEAEAKDLEEAYHHANNCLTKLQHDIYKDSDRMRTGNGTIIDQPKTLGFEYTIDWGKAGVMANQYKEFLKENEEE